MHGIIAISPIDLFNPSKGERHVCWFNLTIFLSYSWDIFFFTCCCCSFQSFLISLGCVMKTLLFFLSFQVHLFSRCFFFIEFWNPFKLSKFQTRRVKYFRLNNIIWKRIPKGHRTNTQEFEVMYATPYYLWIISSRNSKFSWLY